MNQRRIALWAGLAAALLFGFVLGVEYTGRLAIQTYQFSEPAWLATVQRTRWVAIAGFAALGGAGAYLWRPAEGETTSE